MTDTIALNAIRAMIAPYPGKLPISVQVAMDFEIDLNPTGAPRDAGEWPEADITANVEGVSLFFQAGTDGFVDFYDCSQVSDALHECDGEQFSTGDLLAACGEMEGGEQENTRELFAAAVSAVQAIYIAAARAKVAI